MNNGANGSAKLFNISVRFAHQFMVVLCLMLPVQEAAGAASEIICARLTNRTRTDFGVTKRIFEVGVLNKNGTFTPNPDWGMTWTLFVGSAKDAKYRIGGYYNQAPLALSDIPRMKPFYGTNFTFTRIWEEYDEAGNRDPAFDYYEVSLGGNGGVRRQDGTEVTSPQIAGGKQELILSAGGGSINVAEGADIMASTRFKGVKLPPGFSITPEGVLTYPSTTGGGVWDLEIHMSNSFGSATSRVLVKSTVWKTWYITDLASVPTTSSSTNLDFVLADPGNVPVGVIDELSFDFRSNFHRRYLAGGPPTVTFPNNQLGLANHDKDWDGNPLVIRTVKNKPTSAIFDRWTGSLLYMSLSRPEDGNFTVEAQVTLKVVPSPPNDAAIPKLTGHSPKARKVQTREDVVQINGVASDDLALSHITYQLERTNASGVKVTTLGLCRGRHQWSLEVPLLPGINKVIVTAVDFAGKTSRAEQWEVLRLVEMDFSTTSEGEGEVDAAYRGTTSQYIGASLQLNAKPKPGYIFQAWVTQDGTVVSWLPSITREVSPNAYDNSLKAIFIPNPYPALAATYHGVLWDTEERSTIVGQPSVTLSSKGSMSASINYEGATLKVSGSLDGSGSLYKQVNHQGRMVGIMVRANQEGMPQWQQRYNGPANDTDLPVGAVVDSKGNVIVTGWSVGSGTADDYLTLKYSPDGSLLWEKRYHLGVETPVAIAVDVDDNIIVTGSTTYGNYPNINTDYATVKYAPDGTQLWVKRYNGPANRADYAKCLAVDGNGNVIVAGISSNGSNNDYATVKYSADGTVLWSMRYNGPANATDQATALVVDKSGNVIVTGASSNGSNNDYLVIKYASNGTQQWAKRVNGSANREDWSSAVAVDSGGNVLVTGTSETSNNQDFLTLKYSPDGTLLWAQRYNGTANHADKAYAMVVDKFDNAIVGGVSSNGRNEDYTLVSYAPDGTRLWVQYYNGNRDGDDLLSALATDKKGISMQQAVPTVPIRKTGRQ